MVPQSCRAGRPLGAIRIGSHVRQGLGSTPRPRPGAKWKRLAAEQGDARVQYELGNIYAKGEGVPQDYQEAAKWYREAGEQGHGSAQYELGSIYAKGEGVPQDYIKAYAWLSLAYVYSGFPFTATLWKSSIRSKMDSLRQKLTPDQLAQAKRLFKRKVGPHRSLTKRSNEPATI